MVAGDRRASGLGDTIPVDQALRLVRAIKLCEKSGLDPQICNQVRESILASLDCTPIVEPVAKVWKEDASHYELKIRQLVQVNGTWEQMAPLAWRLFELRSSVETAAHILELAFLHGDEADVMQVFNRCFAQERNFYRYVNKAVRNQLLKIFWHKPIGVQIALVLSSRRHEQWLIPTEQLYVLLNMGGDPAAGDGLSYYQSHIKEVHQAVKLVGSDLGFDDSTVFLQVARYAVDAGKHGEALNLLSKVAISSPEYQEALNLNLTIESLDRNAGQSSYFRALSEEPSWQNRVELLKSFINSTRTNEKFRDRNRSSLNILLRDPLKWIPTESDAVEMLSGCLAGGIDIEHLLPSLMTIYEQHIGKVLERPLEIALWQPLLDEAKMNRYPYWRGVAHMHKYLAGHGRDEGELWHARRDLLDTPTGQSSVPSTRLSWPSLLRWAAEWIAQSRTITVESRQCMLLQVSVAGDLSMISPADVRSYLKLNPSAPNHILVELESVARSHQDRDLEMSILRCRGLQTYLRNSDCIRIFQIARERRDYDLAWRVCTVLASRRALDEQILGSWQISGEQRKAYPIHSPRIETIEACLQGMSLHEVKLCRAIVKSGAMIPEIIASADKTMESFRVKSPASGSFEFQVDEKLNQIPWMPLQKKLYFHPGDVENPEALRVPAFAKRVPHNEWCTTLLKLIDRLGISSWNWRMSRLGSLLNSQIAFNISRADHRNFSLRSSRSTRSTTATQRAGLADLRFIAKALADEAAGLCLAKFVCRLSTAMYQNHFQALDSLQNMRVPLAVLRDLENWILSDSYSEVRKACGTASVVAVPATAYPASSR